MSDIEINYQPATNNLRVEATTTVEIKATPEKLFSLSCPVEELRWIPDWEYELVYSTSGVNEASCIFYERRSGQLFFNQEIAAAWVTAIHDSLNHRIQFQIFLGTKAIMQLNLTYREVSNESTTCSWHLIFTALDQEANELGEADILSKMELKIGFLSSALKYYCENDKIIGIPS